MSAAEHPAAIRIRKGRSSDTQLHTAPNSRGPQSEAVRGSARCARSSRRGDGCGQSVGAGCRPVLVERGERGQRPGEPGARLRGRIGRVRRAAHGPRGRVVRADPLGLQPWAQHVGRLRTDASRRREPRLCSRGQGPGRRAGSGAGTRCRHARPGRRPDRPAGGRPCAPTRAPTSAAARPSSRPRRSGSALPTGASTDAGQWYAAVADASGSTEQDVASAFADDAYAVIASGASRRTVDGKQVSLVPSSVQPQAAQVGPTRPAQEAEQRPRSTARPDSPASGSPRPTRTSAAATTATTTSRTGPARRRSSTSSSTTPRDLRHHPQAVQDPTYLALELHAALGPTGTSPSTSRPRTSAGTPATGTSTPARSASSTRASPRQGAWYTEAMYRSLGQAGALPRRRGTTSRSTAQHIIGHDNVPGIPPAQRRRHALGPGPLLGLGALLRPARRPAPAHSGTPEDRAGHHRPGLRHQPPGRSPAARRAGVPCPPRGSSSVILRTAPVARRAAGQRHRPQRRRRAVDDAHLRPRRPRPGRPDVRGRRAAGRLDGDLVPRRKGWFHNPASRPDRRPGPPA